MPVSTRIVGDGAARPTLERQVRDLGLADDVVFVGWVDPDGARREVEGASAVVIPSIWPENLPTVAIEALALGVPIIGSEIGGIPELVEHRVSGLLVEPGDAQALAAALADLRLPGVADRMSHAAAERFSMFDEESFVDRLDALYAELGSSA
jgi:glycosyltransferase involved in cell wall biosynthesis